MLNLFQYFSPKRPSFVDEILTGADQARVRKFYEKCPDKHGFVITVDPSNLSWAEALYWLYEDEGTMDEEQKPFDSDRNLHFFDKPWRIQNDWYLANDMEDEMSSFVYDETTQEVVYVTAGWGKESNNFLSKIFEKIFDIVFGPPKLSGEKIDIDLSQDERTVVASSLAVFLDQLENAEVT